MALDAYLTGEVRYLPGQEPVPVRRTLTRPELPPVGLGHGVDAAAVTGTEGRQEAAASAGASASPAPVVAPARRALARRRR